MCDASMIKEYGLLGTIDSLVNMVGERTAIILGRRASVNQIKIHQPTEEEQEDEEIDEIEGITYAEIQYYSQILAVQLYFRYGIRKGDRVLIACEGSTAAEVTTIIACMRLGAIFVPIDTKAIKQDETSPQAKINANKLANIIEDCRPKIAVITGQNDEDAIVRCLESLGLFRYTLLKSDGSLNDPDASITSDNLSNLPVLEEETLDELYILYTSGSTGRSKGVLGTYRGLINRLSWQLEAFPYDFGETALRRTPLTFVDSLVEIFAPLLASVPICAYLMDSINDFGLLSVLDELALEQITRLTLIPSQLLLACRLNQNLSSTLSSIKYCFVSGEECPITLVEQFSLSLPTSKLVNLYGSTEVAGDVTGILLYNPETPITLDNTKDKIVPLGHPIPGNNLFVVKVNENKSGPLLTLLPSGEVGELLVIGEHVAKGYFGYQPSNLRFISNPFLQNNLQLLENYIIEDIDELFSYSNAILMGDLVSYNQEKDCYYYHGRVDRQVKIRGNRVELDDIERQLLLLWENCSPRNDEFMVVQVKFNQEKTSKEYLVLVMQESLMTRLEVESIQSLKSILQEKLSELYLPDLILVTSIIFPKTSSHKIDRMGLIKRIETFLISEDSTSSDFVSLQSNESLTSNQTHASTNEVVVLILSIFQQVLPKLLNDVSMESLNFLSLGGNSLNAVEVLWLLRKSFPLKQLAFDDLTLSISKLAQKLSSPDSSEKSVIISQDKKPNDITLKPSKPTHKRSFSQALSTPNKISWSSKVYSRGQHHQFELNQYQNWNFQRENLSLQPLPWVASWSYKLLKCADASPLICQGIADSDHSPISYVYMTSYGGDVCCLDAISGHIIWTNELERHVESSISVDLTLKNIFLGTYLKNLDHDKDEPKFGLIHALDMESGEEIWNFPTFGECKATPTIDITRHIVYCSCFQGGVYKLDGKTGELLSQIQVNGPVYAASSLTHEGNFLHVVTTRGEYSLIATEPELTILWQYTFDQTHCFASPTPFPWDDNKILLSANDGSITCLQVIFDPENEENQLICEFLWQMYCSDSPIISSPCCYQSKDPFSDDEMEQQLIDYCFVGSHDGVLRRILLATGEMDWELPVQSVIFTSPIVFTYQKRSYVIVGCTSGVLMLIDILTKEIIQSIELPAEMYSSPVIFGNRVYVGCRDDRLYCFSI